ncbi:LysR family transcriptional regulator [Alicyclobacillus fastidiosus]|uniref:LysR family transcriptional regulator n=1 Tax=Alicyclobacillus fastidiosus TaxID=392011 RepID=A0ABV5AB08_9BACL|nr:LysR family transcriptional regulator [Alicyclobacillus fastidiosus]WEH10578.1 LysR family transcriptional regulator [Alicyclobacillus fastidiosus]
MDYISIETFLTIIKTQSLTKAAELLNLTQSTVSHRLKMLESSLDMVLIERGKGQRSITLTPAGEAFIPISERWWEVWREIQTLKTDGPKLSLLIGSVDSVNAYVLPPVYRRLLQHVPAIDIQIRTQQSTELYDLVERREVDVAFVLRERHLSSVDMKPFFTEPMVVVRLGDNKEHPAAVAPESLDPHDELFINWSPAYQMWHDKWWGSHVRPSRMRLDTAQLILAIMEQPKQWAIVPLSMGRSFKSIGDFVIQNLTDTPPNRVCYQITHKSPRQSAVQAIDILNQYSELLKADMNVDLVHS